MNPNDDLNAVTKAFSGAETSPYSSSPAPPPPLMPGYQVIRELGRGGMGVVYLASQEGLNRSVALKMVLSGIHASAVEKSRFLAEAEAVAAIRHPGVVQVYDFGTQDGRPFFALEYLSGGSLAQRLNGTPLPAEQTAVILSKLAHAVQAAHDSNVIHRDLKPANVLFDEVGEPKITDFGLARRGDSDSGLTQTGAVLGTPSYMSPEQAEGRKSVGPASDIYSLGAILYECLTGRPPFRAATIIETIQQVKNQEPLAPAKVNPAVPRDLETICLKCLSKAPAKRYPSAAELSADLERYQRREPIRARPVSYLERGRHWLRRNPMVGVIAGLVLGGIGLVIGLQASANARLQAERDNARKAEQTATEQRALSQARLRKAVEAVDKMLVRVASERWSLRPELQLDRQQVLEEAMDFYGSLASADSTDPIVRREIASASLKLGGIYLLANKLEPAKASVKQAIEHYEGLIADEPKNAGYYGHLSESLSMRGNTQAMEGRYEDAIADYMRAVKEATTAVELEPANSVHRLRIVQARDEQCFFYFLSNPERGRELHKLNEPLLKKLLAEPNPSFDVLLAECVWLDIAGTFLMRESNFREAYTIYRNANSKLEAMSQLPSPTAHSAEQFTSIRGLILIRLGTCLSHLPVGGRELEDADKALLEGLSYVNGLLKVQPQAFPYRIQKIIALGNLALVSRKLRKGAEAENYLKELTAVEKEMMGQNTQLTWLPSMSSLMRMTELLERVNQGILKDIEPDVMQLIKPTNDYVIAPVVYYNSACVLARAMSLTKDDSARTRLANRAMELLGQARQTGFFKLPKNVELFKKDTDLDSLRQLKQFLDFKP